MSARRSGEGRGLPAAATVALFCICLAFGLAGSASAAGVKAIWGPTELPSGNRACPVVGERCSAFPIYQRLGVDVFQYQVHWDAIAPTRPANPRDPDDPAYDWGQLDAIAAEAARHGIRLALLVQRAPGWANGGRSPIWAPRNPRLFADFLYAAS
ncbi:MAG TPA: hypothetical protein VFU04_08235, partial [Solirubrobacterales bacterium]|nr:hypothetical protein [Solirubrobacterales bacterium]